MAATKKSTTARTRARRAGLPNGRGESAKKSLSEIVEKRKAMRKAVAERIRAKYLKAAENVDSSGKSIRITIDVTPSDTAARIKVADLTSSEGDALDLALMKARQRGEKRVSEILNGPEMLSADAFAAEIGVTRETVNKKRKRHELLGLEGPKRGVRFPRWQLNDRGELLSDLPSLFDVYGDRPWAVYRFLVAKHPELDGRSGLDALRSGDVKNVIEVAKSIGSGAFA